MGTKHIVDLPNTPTKVLNGEGKWAYRDVLVPDWVIGFNGFTQTSSYGSAWYVLTTDTDAFVEASFFPKDSGNYKLIITGQIGGTGYTGNISGEYGVKQYEHDELQGAFSLSTLNLAVKNVSGASYQFIQRSPEFALTADKYTYIRWAKTASEASGHGLYITGIFLERQ